MMAVVSARGATTVAPSGQAPDSIKCEIVLSFALPQQAVVSKIQQALRRRYKIWYWPNESKKYSYEAASRAITDCVTVILCLSADYTSNESCCKEALLAHNSSKRILLVQVSRTKANTDRLPFLRRTTVSLDFSDAKRFDESLAKLYDQIEASIPKFAPVMLVQSESTSSTPPESRRQSVSSSSISRPTTALAKANSNVTVTSNAEAEPISSRSSTLASIDKLPAVKQMGASNASETARNTHREAATVRSQREANNSVKTAREPVRKIGFGVKSEVKRRKLLKCDDDVTNSCLFGIAVVANELFANDVNNGVKKFTIESAKEDRYGEISLCKFRGFTQRNTAGLFYVEPCFLLSAFRSANDRGVWLLNVFTKTAVPSRLPPCEQAGFPCSFGNTENNEVLVAFRNEARIHEYQLLQESSLLSRKGEYKLDKPIETFVFNRKLNRGLAVFVDDSTEIQVLNRQCKSVGSIRPPPLENEFSWRPDWEPQLVVLTDRGLCLVFCNCSKEVHAFDMDGMHLSKVCDDVDILSWLPLQTDRNELDIFFFDRKSHSLEHLSIS